MSIGDIAICPITLIVVTWHNVVGLGEVICIVVEMIPPLKNYRLVGSWRFVLALRRYHPMLMLFRLLEKQIIIGGCRRVHLSIR